MKFIDEMPPSVREFLVYMDTIKGKSPKTVSEYFYDLRTFLRYIKLRKGLVDKKTPIDSISIIDVDIDLLKSITLSDIYDFFGFISSARQNASAARARKVSCLRSFFKYLSNKAGYLENNPAKELESPKIKSSLPRYLSLEEAITLLTGIKGEHKERNLAIITLFLNCGLRLSELVGISLNDIDKSNNSLRVLGKGNKERIVYLNDSCVRAIDKYKEVRPIDGVKDKNALFLSEKKQRISPKTVQWLVKKHIKEAGLDENRYSAHKLRHTAATLMYRNGTDVRALQAILGHENLGTTQIYTHVDDDKLKEAADNNPLNKIIIH